MALRETLARLYTDREARATTIVDGLDQRQVEFFARSLMLKRLNEVSKLMPLTRAEMGPKFGEQFLRYAESPMPAGLHKHSLDAIAFAEHLLRQGGGEVLRWELACLRMHVPRRLFSACWMRHGAAVFYRLRRGGRVRHLGAALLEVSPS